MDEELSGIAKGKEKKNTENSSYAPLHQLSHPDSVKL